MKNKTSVYAKLFSSTFYLSAFTFGGGYVIVPLMKKKFVDELNWIDENEMLNLIAIAQSAPGAVAVNSSILLGYRVAGLLGSMVTVLGTVLPPLIIISIISLFYTAFRDNAIINAILKGMQAGVSAVIVDVILNLSGNIVKDKDIISVVIMIAAFLAVFYFKINIVFIILICGVIGYLRIIFGTKKEMN